MLTFYNSCNATHSDVHLKTLSVYDNHLIIILMSFVGICAMRSVYRV